ncbi:DUF1531-domain-containing protein [Amniculicola lignicola CBS 123094]|uniref:DUF1531-domain-containing protein n=1 Tax=Amniculicola lignicola CBS 123094 TaxID=1392246 RepID=A0A6A5WDA8_9PLEO|nr:DUF1531-domain-containing protein [Amniculicola lignicola CBS 123094]
MSIINPNNLSPRDLVASWGSNFVNNTTSAFDRMRLQDYIRLVVILGGYALLRPYLMKLGSKMQNKAHEADALDNGAEISPNELRGKIEIPGVEDESEDEEDGDGVGTGKSGDWGRTARVRQRKFIREALEREEARLRESVEEEEDKDIAEFLVD